MMKQKIISVLCAFAAVSAFAEVKPAAVIGSNMVFQADMPMRIWGTADAGERIKVSFMKSRAQATADKDGKWLVELPKSAYVRAPQTLTIEGKNKITYENILVGEVWLCSGQSNIEYPLSNLKGGRELAKTLNNPMIRYFNMNGNLQTAETPAGPHGVNRAKVFWTECDPKTAERMSGIGVLFSSQVFKAIDVPMGIINASYGGSRIESWMTREYAEAAGEKDFIDRMQKVFDEGQAKDIARWEEMTPEERRAKGRINKPDNRNGVVGWCYNAMINPLEPFSMRGELWYQGEMNSGNRKEYLNLFPKYAEMMRKKFNNPNLYIYLVQLPDFDNSDWAGVRDSQRKQGTIVPKCGVAVAIDFHEIDLHPRDKDKLSQRLANMALADVYGRKIDAHSPIAPKAKFANGAVKIAFDNAYKGLKTSDNASPKTFELSADGKTFFAAEAKITGKNEVTLKLPGEISSASKVRYAWAADPDVNLYNSADLPVSPFEENVE